MDAADVLDRRDLERRLRPPEDETPVPNEEAGAVESLDEGPDENLLDEGLDELGLDELSLGVPPPDDAA